MKILLIIWFIVLVTFTSNAFENRTTRSNFDGKVSSRSSFSSERRSAKSGREGLKIEPTPIFKSKKELKTETFTKIQDTELGKAGQLKYFDYICFDLVEDVLDFCLFVDIDVYVGWWVDSYGESSVDTTITPFVYVYSVVGSVADVLIAEIEYDAYVSVFEVEVPFDLQASTSEVCYAGTLNKYPTGVFTAAYLWLSECIDDVLSSDADCYQTFGGNIDLGDVIFFSGFTSQFLPKDCISF